MSRWLTKLPLSLSPLPPPYLVPDLRSPSLRPKCRSSSSTIKVNTVKEVVMTLRHQPSMDSLASHSQLLGQLVRIGHLHRLPPADLWTPLQEAKGLLQPIRGTAAVHHPVHLLSDVQPGQQSPQERIKRIQTRNLIPAHHS